MKGHTLVHLILNNRILFVLSFYYFVSMGIFAFMNAYALHVYNALRGQKRTSEPPRLKLQTTVSLHVCSGTQTQVVWKISQCSS